MLALVLGLHLFQQPVCAPEATVLVTEASLRAAEFDLPVAARQLRSAVAQGCASAEVGALFLQGLVDAREAFRQGGTPASLAPVRQAIASLDMLAKERPGPAGIARLTLYAAAAAAQSERDEMRLYLEAAMRMELLQRAANQPGAPLITPAEVAGDLWLQVHGYQEAWQSYVTASQQVGPVLRVLAGIARATARLNNAASACGAFRSLVEEWGVRQAEPPEISEARAYLRRPACMTRAHKAGPRRCATRNPLCVRRFMDHRYRKSVLEQLVVHGVKPTPATPPDLVHEFLNDLYRYELRRLRDRLVRREIPKAGYYDRVVEVRRRYPLLSLKTWQWMESP